MAKNYLLIPATLAGVAAGSISTLTLTARASAPQERRVNVAKHFPADTPALVQIWDRVDAAMCPEAEAEEGWDPDTCAVEAGTVLRIVKGDTEDVVSVSFNFDGTWVKGTAE